MNTYNVRAHGGDIVIKADKFGIVGGVLEFYSDSRLVAAFISWGSVVRMND